VKFFFFFTKEGKPPFIVESMRCTKNKGHRPKNWRFFVMTTIKKYDPAKVPGYFAIAEGSLQVTRRAPDPAQRPDQTQARTLAGIDDVARRAFGWLCQMGFQRPDQWQDLRGLAYEALVYRPWIDRKQGGRKNWLLAAIESGDVARIGATVRKSLALKAANLWLAEYHDAPRLKRNPETGDAIPEYGVREDFAGTVPDFAGDIVDLLDGEEDFRMLSSMGKNKLLGYLSGAILPSYYRDRLRRCIPPGDRLSFCKFLAQLEPFELESRMEPEGILRYDREYRESGSIVQIWKDESGTDWETRQARPGDFFSEFVIHRP
jgi:hypothetical protein